MFKAGRGYKKLTSEEKGAIIAYTDSGWSRRRIAKRIGLSAATVYYWQKRYDEIGDVNRKVISSR
jgi:transposase